MGFFSKIFSKRKIIKTLSGAAGGFLAGGPVGAIAGGAAGMLSGGKGKVFKNFALGAGAGLATGMVVHKLGWQSAQTTIPILNKTFTPASSRVLDYVGSAGAAVNKVTPIASAAANLQGKAPIVSADEAATRASFTPYTDLFNKITPLMSSADGPLYDTSRAAQPSNNLLPLVLLGGAALFLVYA